MTEILLEVTNDEIQTIARDVLNKTSDRGICAYDGLHSRSSNQLLSILSEININIKLLFNSFFDSIVDKITETKNNTKVLLN